MSSPAIELEDETPSGTRRAAALRDPDQEALEIVNRVFQRVAVAKSLVRIAHHVARTYADQKMQEHVEREADPLARIAKAKKIARAAAGAARHAVNQAAARAVRTDQESPSDTTDTRPLRDG